jgi:hypothetical protein
VELKEFAHWKKLYDANDLSEFNFNSSGLLWLKLKSLVRKDLLDNFIESQSIFIEKRTLNEKWAAVFSLLQKENLKGAHKSIDNFIRRTWKKRLKQFNEKELVSELYKLKSYSWGGDYKNSLDKHLVDDYIKVYQSFNELTTKLNNEISLSVQGYVYCSWYNHWSSILIENIFKAHPSVLPTVGQIKKVDFFVSQIPFDLKVTYLPANFIEEKRREYGLKPELAELKQQARKICITFQTHKKSSDTYHEIIQKLKDRDNAESRVVLNGIYGIRKKILDEAMSNPRELIKNLYEKQGEMRFDASNRLFLILVDSTDYDSSWKLRRNLDLLKPTIEKYLDGFANKNYEDLKTVFTYSGEKYSCLADCVFVSK